MDHYETEKPIRTSRNGLDAFTAFHLFINEGILVKTRHPTLLRKLFEIHEQITFAADLMVLEVAKSGTTAEELRIIGAERELPSWFIVDIYKRSKLIK